MNDGFMDGYQNDIPTPAGWKPGQTVIMHQVLCCPKCGSVRVGPHDNGYNQQIVRWQCSDCGEGFKRSAGTAMRVHINAIDR